MGRNEFAVQLSEADQQMLGKVSFYTKRGDVSSETNEATLYRRGDIPFVIKTYDNPDEPVSTVLTAGTLEGLVPRTRLVEGLAVKVDNRRTVLETCIVQDQLKPLDFMFTGEFKDNPERLEEIIRQKAESDRGIFRRGIYLNDPKFLNYGLDENGNVKLLDLGSATHDPFEDDGYLHRMLVRGGGHYFNHSVLQNFETLHTKRLMPPTVRGIELANFYAQTTGLTFDEAVNSNYYLANGQYMEKIAPVYGKYFVRVALEEIEKYTDFKIPDESPIHNVVNATPQNWILTPGGAVYVENFRLGVNL